MSQYWSELVRQLQPYVPGEQPKIAGLIKLNTNESPFPPSPKVGEALQAMDLDRLRLYPDANTTQLKDSLSRYYGLKPEQIFVGNGSDEVLAFAFMAFFKQDQPLLYPDITYSFYPVYCRLLDISAKTVPLRDDFSLALEDYPETNGGIIFPNPNAPTGMALPLSDIEALLERNRQSVVVVDEAYVDFGADSAVALVNRYPNLLVIQTLSKSRALAGLRVGFALGNPELVEGLERVKDSFNSYPVDRLAEVAAVAAIDDRDYFDQCRQQLIATRDWTIQALETLGFDVLPSAGNFVFARPPASVAAESLAAGLREEKILVRHFPKPRIADYLRITIGSEREMQQLLNTLDVLLAEPSPSIR